MISVLCRRVKSTNKNDWNKLVRLMKYLNGTRNKTLTLTADNVSCIKWYIDVTFAVHLDFKSHTGAICFSKRVQCSLSHISRSSTHEAVWKLNWSALMTLLS